ncbi:dihydropteroate synthase [Qipengyuania atrilutea]|uniref:dihydropteroate synthase n=1 Tax=Qipengyuania atrilutea TaxID=2744473 RepID=A0A850HEL3_9SPHN|nr:dihydropteroate synthase [Actirhodobacter atriluteus]NVD45679.1 dihydropteroate synthase [Actirhodobacter atriluteus]
MRDRIYIQPIGFAPGPQHEDGDAVRLAGGMVYAHRFAVLLRRDGANIQRWLTSPEGIANVLGQLPDEVGAEAEAQWSNLRMAHPPLALGERTIRLDQPQIMGILNVTPDSFSDGGRYHGDEQVARSHAAAMLEAGAALLDIGGESTRPGAKPVWEGEEIERVLPAVAHAVQMGGAVSIDTRRAGVMAAALDAGAAIVNDVSALRSDPQSLELVAQRECPVVLMHAPGKGDDLHADARYDDVLLDVFDWLKERRDAAIKGGVARERIILDPGIGFGKSLAENLALLNALPLFHALGQPLVLGASRKRMIGALSNEAPADDRLGGSLTLALAGMNAGVQLLRVHDVRETVQARNVWRGLRDAALTDFAHLPD